jgi:hypothetical protein
VVKRRTLDIAEVLAAASAGEERDRCVLAGDGRASSTASTGFPDPIARAIAQTWSADRKAFDHAFGGGVRRSSPAIGRATLGRRR